MRPLKHAVLLTGETITAETLEALQRIARGKSTEIAHLGPRKPLGRLADAFPESPESPGADWFDFGVLT